MKKHVCFLFAFLFVLATAAGAAHAVPKFLNYQGKLSDASGAPAANGTYQITFSIYDAPTGGTALWTETLNVPVNNGVFAVELGKVTPVPSTLITVPSLFLGIKVGSDPEMTPRSPLHPVPKAFLSEKAEDADKLGGTPFSDFVLKLDPRWNLLSDQDGVISNADSQHSHSVGSLTGTVVLNPAVTQVIQPAGDFSPLAIKLLPGQTKPLLAFQNDAGNVVGGFSPLGGLFAKGNFILNAELTSETTVRIENADLLNAVKLEVEGKVFVGDPSIQAAKVSVLETGVSNYAARFETNNPSSTVPLILGDYAGTGELLVLQKGGVNKFVIDNSGAITVGGVLNALKTNPSSTQVITAGNPSTTPLIVKAASAPSVSIFEVQDFSGGKLFGIMPDGHVLIPGTNKLHLANIDNDSPLGPMGNITIDVIDTAKASKFQILNSSPFKADLSLEGQLLMEGGGIFVIKNISGDIFLDASSPANTLVQIQNSDAAKIADLKVEGAITAFDGTKSVPVTDGATQQFIQGGVQSGVSCPGSTNITFPKPFSAAPVVAITPLGTPVNNHGLVSVTSGDFTLNCGGTGTYSFHWIAIGQK